MTSFPTTISTKNAEAATTATTLQRRLCQHMKVTFSEKVVRLHGVYDASGTIVGEISYFLRRTFTNQHCSLCDITHSTFSRRPTWDSCVANLGIEFQLHHRNDVPATVAATPGYATPCVICEYEDGSLTLFINSNELDSCGNSPEQLMNLIFAKITDKTEG
jgi:hypothetical protein